MRPGSERVMQCMAGRLASILLGSLAVVSSALADGGIVDDSLGDCADMVKAIGAPIVKGDGRNFTLVCRAGHVLAHNDDYKTPIWVVERLRRERFAGAAQRAAKWKSDPDLVAAGVPAAADGDYKGTTSKRKHRAYDRGHMAPAASMKWDADAMRESFYLSNATPQQGHLLNQHIWAELEFLVRDWTCDRGELYVITGPIYDSDRPDTLGANEVAVPTAFYKIAFEPRQRRAITFILPNEEVDSRKKNPSDVLSGYIVPASEVESRAGLRLFDALDARTRKRLLQTTAPMWGVVDGCRLPRT